MSSYHGLSVLCFHIGILLKALTCGHDGTRSFRPRRVLGISIRTGYLDSNAEKEVLTWSYCGAVQGVEQFCSRAEGQQARQEHGFQRILRIVRPTPRTLLPKPEKKSKTGSEYRPETEAQTPKAESRNRLVFSVQTPLFECRGVISFLVDELSGDTIVSQPCSRAERAQCLTAPAMPWQVEGIGRYPEKDVAPTSPGAFPAGEPRGGGSRWY